jgi:putative tryptophan/tyrosine transport system substrate-binding protein
MRRRAFISLLGGAAAAWPLAARAQQMMPVIGHLYAGTPEQSVSLLSAFRQALGENGYVEGRNVAIEYRFANNDASLLPGLAADLVRLRVALIAAAPTIAARAAKAATADIPIVFGIGGDPVEVGLVESLNRPGGNATGVTEMNNDLGAKRLGLLHELLPKAQRFGVLVSRNALIMQPQVNDLESAAAAIGCRVDVFAAGSNKEIDAAFAALVQARVEGLLVSPEPLFTSRRAQLVTLAARHAIPAIYPFREDAAAGGLMSYGSSLTDRSRQMGIYTARILKGKKPAELPVARAVRFDFVINQHAARLLSIAVSPTLLAQADEVIE